ncbi:MAG TPA: hypothetical protein VNG31_07710 [Candidatus Baltobacteraceae bacterium]|nr:hypothetical protein [Candidatus Baltobacteraceae bacterium]
MNTLLIAGMIGLALWWQRHRQEAVRRAHRASDHTLSHALRAQDGWD